MKIDITDAHFAEKMTTLNALQEVTDPELGINIVDLGLIYGIEISGSNKVEISMTLSTPSCPMGHLITAHAKLAVEQALPHYLASVQLVWAPKWSAERISEEGRKTLGW